MDNTNGRLRKGPPVFRYNAFPSMTVPRAAAIAGLITVACSVRVADACTVRSISEPAELVAEADVVVRVKALEQRGTRLTWDELRTRIEGGKAALTTLGTTVRFEVLEVLKGTAPAALEFDGEITMDRREDDNDSGVPRTFVRRGGRHGNCFALQYRAGEEYLLLLRSQKERLTPYWSALAPVNEHVRGADDRWLRWVRAKLADKE